MIIITKIIRNYKEKMRKQKPGATDSARVASWVCDERVRGLVNSWGR